jgi:hypothetical protein
MKDKKTNDLGLSTMLGNASDEYSNDKNHVIQSISFRLILGFVNLYVLISIALFFLVTGNLIEGVNITFLEQGFLSVLNTRAVLLLLLIILLNISAYLNRGFKYISLILIVYMFNSAIDNAIIFSGFLHLTDRPYLSAFNVTRPLIIIALFWGLIIHKDKIERD